MWNLVTRAARNYCHPKHLTVCFYQQMQWFASFTIKDVIHDTSDETGTLITRFAKHIAIESYNFDPLKPRTIKYSNFFPVHDLGHFQTQLQKVPADQLPALIIFAFTYRSNGDPVKFVRVLNDMDSKCLECLPEMDNDTLLRTLYSFLFLIPNKIMHTAFYKAALHRLVDDFVRNFPKEKFVQVCFYLGLVKSNTPAGRDILLKKFLEEHLEYYADQLSLLDMAVVTSAIYKTSSRVSSATYLRRLQQDMLTSPMDDALVVTFVKNMRLQRIKSNDVCKHLKTLCEPALMKEMLSTGLMHIFLYFAENKWDDPTLTKHIVEEFMSRLADRKLFESKKDFIRAKDLGSFVWCCSQLNYQFTDSELKFLETLVIDKVNNDEFNYFPDQLVDCGLSLWTIGMKSRTILQAAQNLKNNKRSNAKPQHDNAKIGSRLIVLQSAAAIEFPAWLPSIKAFEEDCPAPTYLLKTRPDLTNYCQRLSTEADVASAVLVCPIRGINVPSILVGFVGSNQKVFVELLEQEQMLKFSKEPIGLLKLKHNLLTVQGYQVVVLRQQDLGDNYSCLKDFLAKEKTVDIERELLAGGV